MSKKVTILGAGFIGKHLIRAELNANSNVTVFDRNDCPPEFRNKLVWIKANFTDTVLLDGAISRNCVVYHLLGGTVPGDVINYEEELVQNVTHTLKLLEICRKNEVAKFLFLSSSAVYGLQNTIPISEESSTNPISSYGVYKLTIEKYIHLYRYNHGLNCNILRLSNPYGPGQKLYGRQGFIGLVIGKILKSEIINIRGDGGLIRDFIYIDDVINALLQISITETRGCIYNIGSGNGYSLNNIINEVKNLINFDVLIDYVQSRSMDIPLSILDNTKINNELFNFEYTSLKNGLIKTLNYNGIYTKY